MSEQQESSTGFGKNMKEIRKAKKLTLEELSQISGISQPYLSQIETGNKGNPTVNVLVKLAKALDVSYAELTKDSGGTWQDNNKASTEEGNAVTQIQFDILYQKGHEEYYLHEVTEENKLKIREIIDTFKNCFFHNDSGLVTLGDEMTNGALIRVSDVSRVKITIIEGENK